MKALRRTLFLALTVSSIVWGDMEVCFKGEPFKDIDAFNNALYWELRRLDQYSKNSFNLRVIDTADYRTFGYLELHVQYEEGIIYLLGEFDKYKTAKDLHAYCATLARVFLLISHCGYPLKLVETEEAIRDVLWGTGISSVTCSTGKNCLIINGVHKEEMFIVANLILAGNHAIGKLILEDCEVKLNEHVLADCACTGIVFKNCDLNNAIVESLLQCKSLGILKLLNCRFPVNTFIEALRDKLLRPEISCIYKIDLTGNALDSEAKKQLWFLGHIFCIYIFGIEDGLEVGYKCYQYKDDFYEREYKKQRALLPADNAFEDMKEPKGDDFEDFEEFYRTDDAHLDSEDPENFDKP